MQFLRAFFRVSDISTPILGHDSSQDTLGAQYAYTPSSFMSFDLILKIFL